MTETAVDIDQLAINTIRFLAIDMVEAASSGHPGAPMGQAAMAYALWTRHLVHDPSDPAWPNRDRFVLSCGHASALIYALLHLSGYDLPLTELRDFRQWGSKTPGHPENHLTPGVETTTGPLGQGLSNAVGMAIARKLLAARFHHHDPALFDYRIWVFASDGDLMEGVASEASSLAAHLQLGDLIVFYDDNEISIDGSTDLAFTEDVEARYRAYGWHVERVEDGNDLGALDAAIAAAKAEAERPSLIAVRTHIGFGSPNKQDTAGVHGAPLGPEEAKLTRAALGWTKEEPFHIPEEARRPFAEHAERGRQAHRAWGERLEAYRAAQPNAADELERRLAGNLPAGWEEELPRFRPDDGPLATRLASGKVLNAIAATLPELVGGSADLAGSNNTYLTGYADVSARPDDARNFYFGVREHAMGSILNGLTLNGGFRAYGGTFLIFSDYMRPAIRLAALMRLPVIYVFTHDSIFLGEDGPTHQPVSQLLSLRAIPGLTVIRPADANETAEAWRAALENTAGPTALALTRQKLPILEATAHSALGLRRGAYVLADPSSGKPEVVLLASGSEVSLALAARVSLAAREIAARVVSFPSWELFDRQETSYRQAVLPPGIPRLAIEAGTPLGWERYVGEAGDILGVEGFGASAPNQMLAERYGFTTEEIARRVDALLSQGTK